MDIYYQKYQKYKLKYLNSKYKKQLGGSKNVELYFFKADWCGHCKNFMPTWDSLIEDKTLKNKIEFKKLDSEINKKEMIEWNISGYPTIILKKNNKAIEYNGSRKIEDIKKFLQEYI